MYWSQFSAFPAGIGNLRMRKMATKLTVDAFLDRLAASGLLNEEVIGRYRGLPGQRVVYQMIEDGVISAFQARQFLAGRSRGFFIHEKYKIVDELGRGGMGRVLLCEQLILERLVAVKLMDRELAKRPGAIERFLREARTTAKFDHPHLVRVFDVDTCQQGPYIVMEYIDGTNLHLFTESHGRLSPTQTSHYIRQAAIGLQQAHQAGLVHRDIKPGNLMLDRSGTVKLVDLGLARVFDNGPADRGLTAEFDQDAVLGTADFIAPEQAMECSRADIRADIYSLGCTAYYLLTRQTPVGSGTALKKLLRHQSAEPTPIESMRSDVPEALLAVIRRMMSKKPDDRYATPSRVADALAPLTAEPIAPPAAEHMPGRRAARFKLGLSASGSVRAKLAQERAAESPSDGPPVSPVLASKFSDTNADRAATSGPEVSIILSSPSSDSSPSPPPATPRPAEIAPDKLSPPPHPRRRPMSVTVASLSAACAVLLALMGVTAWNSWTSSRGGTARPSAGGPPQSTQSVDLSSVETPADANPRPAVPATILRSGGSSFVKPIMDHWARVYEQKSGRRIEYASAGSSRGVEGVMAGFLDFGCSDAPLTDAQIADSGGKLLHVPLVMGAVVPTYNVTGPDGRPLAIQFTGPLLAEIFLGKVTRWNDPTLAANNAGVELPDLAITVVARKDGSGTTNIWTDYLSKSSAAWKARVGVANKVTWPVGVQAEKNNGVADLVSRTEGAIGYVELSYALANGLAYGAVRNREGMYVKASVESITSAAAESLQTIPADFRYSLTDAPGQNAYPIVGTTWALFSLDLAAEKRKEAIAFMRWATADGQQHLASLHYGRLPPDLVTKIRQSLDTVTTSRADK
jgi:phosphate ABC transporter phosphate-binding protein